MVNWDGIIQSTPNFLRATVIIVLLGLIVVGVAVLSLAVLSGRGLQAWGLKVDEFHSPEVQKCASIAGSMPYVNTVNQDALDLLNSQIAQSLAFIDKNMTEAANINHRGGLSSVADTHRGEAKKHRDDLTALRKSQNEIINSRSKIASTMETSCTSIQR